MKALLKFFIRVFSFLRKELAEVIRQPRLILTLILGPFLILLLFGLGYSNQARRMKTLFVVPPGSQLGPYVEEHADDLVEQLDYAGIVGSEAQAKEMLRHGEVDLVIVTPTDAYSTIRDNERARFTLYHREIDPAQVGYVEVFGQVYVGEVNRRVLRILAEEGQTSTSTLRQDLEAARGTATALERALNAGDPAEARRLSRELEQELLTLRSTAQVSALLLSSIQEVLNQAPLSADEQEPLTALEALQEEVIALRALPESENASAVIDRVQAELDRTETLIDEFERIEPEILVSPFDTKTANTAPVPLDVSDFYAPAVIVLLLQHMCITFAGLSIVGERRTGAIELFRVAPLSTVEVLLGKYLSYILFASAITAILTPLLIFGLGVPMVGNLGGYVLAILGLIFTSLGIGFIISLLAETTSQAVQLAMILLLTSVFFSGFFLSLEMLREPVRWISNIIPATYGVQLLQAIMLRGLAADGSSLAILAGGGLALFLLAWALLHHRMKNI